MSVDLSTVSIGSLMNELGRRLACNEKRPQNIVLVGVQFRAADGRAAHAPAAGAVESGVAYECAQRIATQRRPAWLWQGDAVACHQGRILPLPLGHW
jgi:hypothetical protein